MARIRKSQGEAELRRRGLYGEYVARRKQLRELYRENGQNPRDAWRTALRELLGDWAPSEERPVPMVGGDGSRNVPRIPLEAWNDGEGSLRETATWVSKNIGVFDSRHFTSPPPSREAVALLNWVNASAGNESEFWTKIWPKFIPSKLRDGDTEGFADDGRHQLAIIERIESRG